MLGYGNTPAGPMMLRPWMTCPAGSWPLLAGGRGRLTVTRTCPRRSGPVARPIQEGFALVSPARNCADTISPPKCY